jgi:transposase
MQAITTIGLDIAKSVFQVHGIDAEGKVLIRRQVKTSRRSVGRCSHVFGLLARFEQIFDSAYIGWICN